MKKSDSPYTALFADQALERKIKELKGVDHLVGIIQDKMRSHLIVLSSHCHTSPRLPMSGYVDSHASQLPPILRVSIISCLETSPYAQREMH